jgi:fructan beta-fructosidase
MLAVHRNSSTGKTNFNGSFSIPSMQAPLNVEGSTVQVDLYVDQSSIEIITQDGAMSMTNLVFPQSIYDQLTISNANSTAQVRSLSRIW